MRKYLLLGLIGIFILALAACGGNGDGDEGAQLTPEATAPATATSPPVTTAPATATSPPATTAPGSQPAAAPAAGVPATLAAYAAEYAGGPGAIYVGDLNQLAGPAPTEDQGDADGNVPLDALQRHLYVYESDYYKDLLERAKLTDPTPAVTTGEDITIQYACINRALLWCKLVDSYFFPNVLERTNGQVKLQLSSYPELGIAGPDVLGLISDGTLAMADIGGPYVAGEVPALEIQYLFGLFPDQETQFRATADMYPDIVKLHEDSTDGGKMISLFWLNGNDVFFFSKKPLRTVADFEGLKTRAFGTAIADWINGMGADSQFVAFAEVYTALERGILDAGVTGGDAGHGQRWYEVADYINGPLPAWPTLGTVINKQVWEKLAPDLQQIMIEESAKNELENLRLGAIQNELGLSKNINAGMEYVGFSPEVRAHSDRAVLESVAPNWVKRVGADSPFIQVFNEHIGTRVGLRVEPGGSVVKAPVTKE